MPIVFLPFIIVGLFFLAVFATLDYKFAYNSSFTKKHIVLFCGLDVLFITWLIIFGITEPETEKIEDIPYFVIKDNNEKEHYLVHAGRNRYLTFNKEDVKQGYKLKKVILSNYCCGILWCMGSDEGRSVIKVVKDE